MLRPAELHRIDLTLSENSYTHLKKKRDLAFERGLLKTESDSWVKGTMIANGDTSKIKIRLKGDWLDHLKDDKWSFRIKMKDNHFKNVQEFSLQRPETRHFMSEYVFHEFLLGQQLLTTSYDFVTVFLNGERLGVYAFEEHFTKELIEHKGYREGPLFRFSEDGFWNLQHFEKQTDTNVDFQYPTFMASEIRPYEKKKTYKDSVKRRMFLQGRDQLEAFRQGKVQFSEVFNVRKEAKLFALADVFQAHHGLIWHNRRFYFNPMTSQLESVFFDAFMKEGGYVFRSTPMLSMNKGKQMVYSYEQFFVLKAFNDPVFRKAYFEELDHYLNVFDWDQYFRVHKQNLDRLNKNLNVDYPEYKYDQKVLLRRIDELKKMLKSDEFEEADDWFTFQSFSRYKDLHPDDENIPRIPFERMPFEEVSLRTFSEKIDEEDKLVTLQNFHFYPIEVVGIGTEKEEIKPFKGIVLDGYRDSLEVPETTFLVDLETKYLHFTVEGLDSVFQLKISKWAPPKRIRPRKTAAKGPFKELSNSNWVLRKGSYTVKQDIVIPREVYATIEPGTTINLTNGAGIVCFGHLDIKATTDSVVITSSDQNNNGLCVLGGKVSMENVRLNNLRANKSSFYHSGGVTFYDSRVTLKNVEVNDGFSEDGINIVGGSSFLGHCSVNDCPSDGLDIDAGQAELSDLRFDNIGNDALDVSYTQAEIDGIQIVRAFDKGISIGEKSQLNIENCKLSNCYVGIIVKDESTATIRSPEIANCNRDIVLFNKKEVFEPATTFVFDGAESIRFDLDKGTRLVVDEKEIIGTKSLDESLFIR